MSNKSFKALKNLTHDELNTKERELQSDLFQARMKLRTGQLENVASIWKQRKDLARVKMLLTAAGKKTPSESSAKLKAKSAGR